MKCAAASNRTTIIEKKRALTFFLHLHDRFLIRTRIWSGKNENPIRMDLLQCVNKCAFMFISVVFAGEFSLSLTLTLSLLFHFIIHFRSRHMHFRLLLLSPLLHCFHQQSENQRKSRSLLGSSWNDVQFVICMSIRYHRIIHINNIRTVNV